MSLNTVRLNEVHKSDSNLSLWLDEDLFVVLDKKRQQVIVGEETRRTSYTTRQEAPYRRL